MRMESIIIKIVLVLGVISLGFIMIMIAYYIVFAISNLFLCQVSTFWKTLNDYHGLIYKGKLPLDKIIKLRKYMKEEILLPTK